jgi:tetratricopeptide (TPR) repeat protein
MKIIAVILFVLLILLGISALLFLAFAIISKIRGAKSLRKRSKGIKEKNERSNLSFSMLAEYYGGLRKSNNGELGKLFEEGLALKQQKKFSEAIKAFEKCLDQDLTLKQRVGALLTTGNCHFAKNDLDKAKEYYGEANSRSQESDNHIGRLSSLVNLGMVCASEKKWDEAIRNYHQAIGLDQKLGHTIGEAIDLNTLALLYENKGDLEGALTHYTASLLILKRANEWDKARLVENNIKRVRSLGIKEGGRPESNLS